MNNKEKFENFLESLKGNGQDVLIESVKSGFQACYEGWEEHYTQSEYDDMRQKDADARADARSDAQPSNNDSSSHHELEGSGDEELDKAIATKLLGLKSVRNKVLEKLEKIDLQEIDASIYQIFVDVDWNWSKPYPASDVEPAGGGYEQNDADYAITLFYDSIHGTSEGEIKITKSQLDEIGKSNPEFKKLLDQLDTGIFNQLDEIQHD